MRDALHCRVVYHHLDSQGGVAFLRELGDTIDCRGSVGVRQICDGVLASEVNFMRELAGPAWVPTEVLLAHAAPTDASPCRQSFCCPVRFNAQLNVLRFPSHWLARAVQGSDPRLPGQLEAQANVLVPASLVRRLRRSLRLRLLNRVFSGDTVAEMLTVHRRTLNRSRRPWAPRSASCWRTCASRPPVSFWTPPI